MPIERSNFRFLPSEEARLILGYLETLGLWRTANSLLEECTSLVEYRSLGKRRGSGLSLLGLSLEEVFDHFFLQNYVNLNDTAKTVKSVQTDDVSLNVQSHATCLIHNSTQTDDCRETTATQTEVISSPESGRVIESPCIKEKSNWPDFKKYDTGLPYDINILNETPRRPVSSWITRKTQLSKIDEISNFYENANTFDLSFESGSGLSGSKRKSFEPRKSLVVGEELSNSDFCGDFPNFTGDIVHPVELCVDDFMSTLGNETVLNNILGFSKEDESVNDPNDKLPVFSSPNPSPVTPRRISLLKCTPSPHKRLNGSVKEPKKQRIRKTDTTLSFNISVSEGSDSARPPRRSLDPLPFDPPPYAGKMNTSTSVPPGFFSKKRRTPYVKKSSKRRTDSAETSDPQQSDQRTLEDK